MRPRLLDLFCGAGGCSEGYYRAGFDIVGVDIELQPRWPFFEVIQSDALAILAEREFVDEFDVIHASPPCEFYSLTQRIMKGDHPDLIDEVRDLLEATGKPYVIENVEGAPLRDPLMLCGAMFDGLRVYRHRLFESNVPLTAPPHPRHDVPLTKMGRRPDGDTFLHVVGNFIDVEAGREAMGIDWMTRDELAQAIPPAYTEHIGRQLMRHLDRAAA